jgi:hypothetical protein
MYTFLCTFRVCDMALGRRKTNIERRKNKYNFMCFLIFKSDDVHLLLVPKYANSQCKNVYQKNNTQSIIMKIHLVGENFLLFAHVADLD